MDFKFLNIETRRDMVNSLMRNLKKRFDYRNTVLGNLDFISPRRILDIREWMDIEAVEKRKEIYKFFGKDESIEEDFTALVRKLDGFRSSDKHMLTDSVDNSYVFYLVLLESKITDSQPIRDLLEGISSLPLSTAEVERGFSILFNIREGKSSMTNDNLAHRMRININGPEASDFDASETTKKWLTKHRAADDPRGVRGEAVTSRTEEELRREKLEEFVKEISDGSKIRKNVQVLLN